MTPIWKRILSGFDLLLLLLIPLDGPLFGLNPLFEVVQLLFFLPPCLGYLLERRPVPHRRRGGVAHLNAVIVTPIIDVRAVISRPWVDRVIHLCVFLKFRFWVDVLQSNVKVVHISLYGINLVVGVVHISVLLFTCQLNFHLGLSILGMSKDLALDWVMTCVRVFGRRSMWELWPLGLRICWLVRFVYLWKEPIRLLPQELVCERMPPELIPLSLLPLQRIALFQKLDRRRAHSKISLQLPRAFFNEILFDCEMMLLPNRGQKVGFIFFS